MFLEEHLQCFVLEVHWSTFGASASVWRLACLGHWMYRSAHLEVVSVDWSVCVI